MPWTKGILHFTMAVIMLSSSSRAGPETFSEMGAAYGGVSESTTRFGKLLIGAQSAVSDLRSAEQSDKYQSDEGRFYLAKAKLQRLGSSVHCGNDSMTLRIQGSRMPHFLVDRGDRSPVPLSEMPASCGFSLKRVRRDVSLVAPYQGCHVRRQGGSYVLPLVIMGAPVQMACPDTDLQLPLCGDQEMTLPCPVTQPTLAPTTVAVVQDSTDSQQLFYPFPFRRPWWYSPGVRPVPPTTTPSPQDPNQQIFNQMHPMFYPHYFNYKHFPLEPPPQQPRYPMFPPYMYHFKNPVATTTTSTTTAAQFEPFAVYPMDPEFYGPQPFVPPGVRYPFMSQYP